MRISRWIAFVLLLVLWSCQGLTPDFNVFVPDKERTAFVRKTNFISNTATTITYEVEFQIIDWYSFEEDDYTILFEDDLLIDANTKTENFQKKTFSNQSADEVIFLIDQSGDYTLTDPHNTRSQVINKFAHDFTDPDFTIGGFSQNGLLNSDPIEYLPSSDTDENAFTQSLFAFAKRTGGESNLYDALNAALDNFTSTGSRHLVVLVQSTDQSSATSSATIIAKANAMNVKIDIIALGQNISLNTLSAISQQTGGFFAACDRDKEMVAIIDSLNRILTDSSEGYKIMVQWTPGGTILPGSEFVHEMQPVYFYDQAPFNKFYSFIKVP